MKKKLSLLLATAVISASVLGGAVACKKDTGYDLVYANWNLGTAAANNIERQMIKEFEKRNDVKIKIEENISLTAYDDSIRSLAIKNNLPDVFMLSNINFGLSEQYVIDISDYTEKDEDWGKIPKPIEEAVHFKGGAYAIPFAMHMMGYFVNTELLADHNIRDFDNKDASEITMNDFISVVEKMSQFKKDGEIGLNKEMTIFEWYPSSANENYGWFSWDGSNYHLDSDEFKRGVEITVDMYKNGYTYTSLTPEELADDFNNAEADEGVGLWNNGGLAIRWGYTAELPDMMQKSDFSKRFIGVPGGRTPIVGDYLGISTTCKNVELAYKFAKWMSFDPAGMRKRIELNDTISNTLPITTDSEIVAEYFNKFVNESETPVLGLEEAYENLDNGIVEAVKVVPGYNRSRWTALTGIALTADGMDSISNADVGQFLDWCRMGLANYSDHALDVNKLANKWYGDTIKEYDAKYPDKTAS